MSGLPTSITVAVVVLTVFLTFITALKYAVENNFVRTRLIMSAFFLFIIATLSISFWRYTLVTLPYTIPASLLGASLGYFLGVRTEQAKLRERGLAYYKKHFAHIHMSDVQELNWWSVINFYSVMGALALINLVGLSTVIYHGSKNLAIGTSSVGAFLLGTIAPYLAYLWSIKATKSKSTTTSE